MFRLEPEFLLGKGGKCKPDIVLSSLRVSHTLVVEWTNATSVHDNKKNQLDRYSKVTKSDLTIRLAVPPKEAKTFDIVLVVCPGASDSFRRYVDQNKLSVALFSFSDADTACTLAKLDGTLREEATEQFFARPMSFRIPLRYIPFSLDNPSPKELVTHIVTHVVSLMVRGVKEFTIDSFCSGFVSAWNVIAASKQGEIRQATKRMLDRLSHKPVGQELLARRLKVDPPTWQLLRSPIGQTNAESLFAADFRTSFVRSKERHFRWNSLSMRLPLRTFAMAEMLRRGSNTRERDGVRYIFGNYA